MDSVVLTARHAPRGACPLTPPPGPPGPRAPGPRPPAGVWRGVRRRPKGLCPLPSRAHPPGERLPQTLGACHAPLAPVGDRGPGRARWERGRRGWGWGRVAGGLLSPHRLVFRRMSRPGTLPHPLGVGRGWNVRVGQTAPAGVPGAGSKGIPLLTLYPARGASPGPGRPSGASPETPETPSSPAPKGLMQPLTGPGPHILGSGAAGEARSGVGTVPALCGGSARQVPPGPSRVTPVPETPAPCEPPA